MNTYNSDGYILIDLKEADVTQTTQHISGLYNRVAEEVAKINKLAIVINAGNLTPLPAVVQKTLNYYVVTTPIYIFKINSNDILIIEEAGEVTVDVSIVPTLTEGVKVADFAIGSTEGSIYAPEFQTEINDSVTSDHLTWSSEKIDDQLDLKADSADLSAVATSGSYNDLSNKPTIPTKTSDLTNDSGFITSAQVPTIDDTSVSSSSVWSSYKTSYELGNKANSTDVYTKSEVDTALSAKQNSNDNNLATTNKTVVGAINELKSEIDTYITDTLTHTSSDTQFYFTKVGHVCQVEVNEDSQVSIPTSWANIGTINSAFYKSGLGYMIFACPIIGNHTISVRINKSSGTVDIQCDTSNNVWAQGRGLYLL